MTDDNLREHSGAVNPTPLRGSVMNERKQDAATSAVIAEAYSTFGLKLTAPQARCFVLAALRASAPQEDMRETLRRELGFAQLSEHDLTEVVETVCRHLSAPQGDGRVLEECDWPNEPFTFRDEPGEHDPCYVVMPGGGMLALNHHAGEGLDIARAKFIVAACNAALTGEAARWFSVAQTEAAGRERMSQLAASRLSAPPSVALEAGRAHRETLGMDGTLPERMRMMPSSLNDACRTLEAGAEEIDRLRALTRPQPGGAVAGTERGGSDAA